MYWRIVGASHNKSALDQYLSWYSRWIHFNGWWKGNWRRCRLPCWHYPVKKLARIVMFLLQVSQTYTCMVLCLKGTYLTLNSWCHGQEETEWKILKQQRDDAKLDDGLLTSVCQRCRLVTMQCCHIDEVDSTRGSTRCYSSYVSIERPLFGRWCLWTLLLVLFRVSRKWGYQGGFWNVDGVDNWGYVIYIKGSN